MGLPESKQELEALIRKVIWEELNRLHLPLLRSSFDESGSSTTRGTRTLKLYFDCQFPSRVFTEKKIQAKGGQLLKVVLQDVTTGDLISEGPFSTLKLEIVVLPGDFKDEIWSEKEFNDSVLTARQGRRPLLIGDSQVITLNQGVAFLHNLSISDNSSWLPSKKFRLGVRVSPHQALVSVGVGGVQEAVSQAFEVKDKRGESYEKHDIPSLEDKVWRLSKIAKDGVLSQKLAANQMHTVRDFLQHYYTDPSSLRRILGNSKKTWDTIVEHAKTCVLNDDHYYYADEGVALVFNCVLDIVGVKYDGGINYLPLQMLTKSQKSQVERLRRYAYANQNQLVPFDVPATASTIQSTGIVMNGEHQMGMDFGGPESGFPYGPCLVEQSHHIGTPMNVQASQQAPSNVTGPYHNEPIQVPNKPSLHHSGMVTAGCNMIHQPMSSWANLTTNVFHEPFDVYSNHLPNSL